MTTASKTIITVETSIHAPVKKVWEKWTTPADIKQWNHASEDWHTTRVENNLVVGGEFLSRMEAKDGSIGFDFAGKYDAIKMYELIAYSMMDGRKVNIHFSEMDGITKVVESFDAETQNPVDMQRMGWQSILDNFKKHTENAI